MKSKRFIVRPRFEKKRTHLETLMRQAQMSNDIGQGRLSRSLWARAVRFVSDWDERDWTIAILPDDPEEAIEHRTEGELRRYRRDNLKLPYRAQGISYEIVDVAEGAEFDGEDDRPCPHGKEIVDCDACYRDSDFAYDAARERS